MGQRTHQMWQMRQSGATLRHIADAFGLSREGVRKLLVKYYRSTRIGGLLAVYELAELASCGPGYISKLRYRGIIRPLEISGRKHTLWVEDTVATIIAYKNTHPEICQICGNPLPTGRSAYCCFTCYVEGSKIRNRPEVVRRRQNESVRNWLKNHPESAKQIRTKAQKKYRAKCARERYRNSQYVVFRRCPDIAIPLGSLVEVVNYQASKRRLSVKWSEQVVEVPLCCVKRIQAKTNNGYSRIGD